MLDLKIKSSKGLNKSLINPNISRKNVKNNDRNFSTDYCRTSIQSNYYYPLIKTKQPHNVAFSSALSSATVGQATILISKKPVPVDVIARKVSENILNLSLMKNTKCYGYVNVEINANNIKILLMDKSPDSRELGRVGSNLLQIVAEIATKFEKEIILDSVRVDEIRDNPLMFYLSRGFKPRCNNINTLIAQEVQSAREEFRKPNPNIFDKLGKIEMYLPKQGFSTWQEIIKRKPILDDI